MRFTYNYFLFLGVFIVSLASNAQDKLFTNQNLSKQLETLEILIHHKIDSLRAKKKLESLENDVYLKKAAQLHADWMNEKEKLTHFQNKSKTKTPQDRVEMVGGKISAIGENVAYTLFNTEIRDKKGKLFINSTYQQVANDLVQMWRNSKGHYKNIITKDFSKTGIALSVDFETNKIYATQVFGGQ